MFGTRGRRLPERIALWIQRLFIRARPMSAIDMHRAAVPGMPETKEAAGRGGLSMLHALSVSGRDTACRRRPGW